MVGIAAGVFALMGLAMLMHGIAWLLNDLFFEDDVWIGFMVEAAFWFVVAAGARACSPTARCKPARRRRRTWRSRRPGAPRRRWRPARGERAPPTSTSAAPASRSRRARPGAPGRSSDQIRADIERQRSELGRSVEALRGRVAELTDWRRQIREHRRELAIGAAVVGFAIGGLIALAAAARHQPRASTCRHVRQA